MTGTEEGFVVWVRVRGPMRTSSRASNRVLLSPQQVRAGVSTVFRVQPCVSRRTRRWEVAAGSIQLTGRVYGGL